MVGLTALSDAQLTALEHPSVPKVMRALASHNKLHSRPAPFYSSKKQELVVSLKDVSHLIKTGDGSWYRGVKPWSLAIRMGTQSMVSHAGTLLVDEKQNPYNIDTCELIGCRIRPLNKMVEVEHGQNWHTGQWYWGPVAEEFRDRYDEEATWEYARQVVGSKYGHVAILFVAASLMPGFRELLFLRCGSNIEKDWKNIVPYCSILQDQLAVKGSKVDACPGRALQLTTPQDTWQSLFWGPKVALIP